MELNIHKKYHVACFSQSGREILEISKRSGTWPDRIITNKQDLTTTVPELLIECEKRGIDLIQVPRISAQDYRELFPPDSLVTLHGWLKIIPPEVCEEYCIYNVHPGDTKNPLLRGKDPQQKVLEYRLPVAGVTIHEVTSELDGGEIIRYREIPNRYVDTFLTADVLKAFIDELREVSIQMWVELLNDKILCG